MGEVILAAGKEGQRYSRRGGAAARAKNGRLYRVSDEAQTMDAITARTGLTPAQARNVMSRCKARRVPVTWAEFADYTPKKREAANV